jgi:WD40 repeat protein
MGRDDQSLGCRRVGADTLAPLRPNLTKPVLVAASLELKGEKESAHDCPVLSVAFSPKGNTIVSASGDIFRSGRNTIASGLADKTIKVWDAGTL